VVTAGRYGSEDKVMNMRVSALLLLGCLAIPALAAEPLPPEESSSLSPPAGFGMVPPHSDTAGPPPGDYGYGMGPEESAVSPAPPPFADIQFTDAQRKTIGQMMAKEREAHRKRITVMQQAETKLRQLLSADTWDTKAILSVYDQIFTAERSTIEAMAAEHNQIYSMLSKEQRLQMRYAQPQRIPPFMPPPQP